MRSILKIKKPTRHFEDHLRSDVAGAVPTSHFENHLRSYETKKIVEGSNKGGITSANDNNGETMASNNACV